MSFQYCSECGGVLIFNPMSKVYVCDSCGKVSFARDPEMPDVLEINSGGFKQ